MGDVVHTLFGEGSDLDPLQMTLRAIAVFALALGMIRVSGRRSFGQHSPFDACTTVLLGAVLSRAVVGASPFWPTVGAGAVLVVMHRGIALACVRWPRFDLLITGRHRVLVHDGNVDQEAL